MPDPSVTVQARPHRQRTGLRPMRERQALLAVHEDGVDPVGAADFHVELERWFGLELGLMFAALSAALIVAGKLVVPQATSVEERGLLLEEEVVDEVVEQVESGGEGISRRGLLVGAGTVAGAGVAVALATPVASLGPNLTGIHDTPWQRGVRMVDESGNPYLASEIETGSWYTALPEHGDPENVGAGLIVVKLPPEFLQVRREGRLKARLAGREPAVLAVSVTLGNHRYDLERAEFGARPVAKVCHQSGGVVLSTRTVSPEEWSRGLAEALVRTLGADAAAVEALQRLTAP